MLRHGTFHVKYETKSFGESNFLSNVIIILVLMQTVEHLEGPWFRHEAIEQKF